MTSHIEVALGTFPELVDIFTNEILGEKIDEARKDKLVAKLKKIDMPLSDFCNYVYLPPLGSNRSVMADEMGLEGRTTPIDQYLEKHETVFGIKESTTFVSGLLEAVSQLEREERVFASATHIFNDWWVLPSQIMQPWRTRRIPLCYLHYYDIDGINVAGIDKLHDLKDIVELAKLYPYSKNTSLSLHTALKSEGLKAIVTVLNNITHVRQFNRFVKVLASTQVIEALREETHGIATSELESEYESVLEDINASLFRTSIDIRHFAYLRVIDLLLG